MGEYEVEVKEVANAGFYGDVFFTDDTGRRTKIGQTPVSGMKPRVTEHSQEIVRLHKQVPEVVELDAAHEVEIHEVENAGFYGQVFCSCGGERTKIGETPIGGLKPVVAERAQEIVRLHKQSPGIISL
jgi:hypothetical protein